MSLLIESIKVKDGQYLNLFYHEQRMNRSLRTLCGSTENIDLEKFLGKYEAPADGIHKCRIVYDDNSMEVEYTPYQMKVIETLQVVEHDRINYEFKYADRRTIDRLFAMRGKCDDILIVKRGIVADTSFCNIVFRRENEWVTPWAPLLKGTQRQKLIDDQIIIEEEIRITDLPAFDSWKLINAMIEFDAPENEISNIERK